MKKYFVCKAFFFLICFTSVAQTGFKNPAIPGFYPDPSICRAGNDFYLITSSFSYFPGVPIWHSRDLVNWEQIGHVLTTNEQLPLEHSLAISDGIYAPTIRYHQGTFYVITTNITTRKNFFVTAKDPRGPWSAPIWLDLPVKGLVIDPSLFFDDDGKVYLITSPSDNVGGNAFAEIDIKTGKVLSPMKSIWKGLGGRYPEGPHLYKKDGWYYLLMSEGGTEYGHKIQIARSRKIDGPYESNPANPILTHIDRNMQTSPIQGTGHADFVDAPDGSWWMVALGFRPNGMHHILGRETFMAPIEWNKDGWPVINKNGTLSLSIEGPTLPLHPVKAEDGNDDFNNDKLDFKWNMINNPVSSNYSLSERPGFLRLKGSKFSLSQGKSVTFIGRRQRHFDFTASTLLTFKPSNANDEAGLTVFMDYKSHYNLAVKNINGRNALILTYNLGLMKHDEKTVVLDDGPVQLKVEGTKDTYTFSFSQNNEGFQVLGKMDTKYLSSETAGGFTGVYLGMYATGNGQESTSLADFDWFKYEYK